MQIGIAGLKSSGKSTFFDVLIGKASTGMEKPGEARNGIMPVPDERVDFLEVSYNSKKVVHPAFQLLDLPSLQTSSSQNDKSAVKILEEYKRCDALIHVIRQFTNPAVPIPDSGIDPSKEKVNFESELILTDLTVIENRLERITKLKGKQKDLNPREPEILERCKEVLENEKPLITVEFSNDDRKVLSSFQFLTMMPVISVINIDEDELGNEIDHINKLVDNFPEQKGNIEAVCCQAEREILDLDEEEREVFREELGITTPAPVQISSLLIRSMKLIRFLTGGEQESRSWIIPAETRAQEAGGAIHSDIEKGFIRMEVVSFEEFKIHGSEAKCKEAGCYRLEGKDYIVQDGDMAYFRFNV